MVDGPVGLPVTGSGHVKVTVASVTSQAPDTVPLAAFDVNGTEVPQRTALPGGF
jgi:hypothetical protein